MADEVIDVPGGSNNHNYANVKLIVQIATACRADAVWAGWGHASENPQVRTRCVCVYLTRRRCSLTQLSVRDCVALLSCQRHYRPRALCSSGQTPLRCTPSATRSAPLSSRRCVLQLYHSQALSRRYSTHLCHTHRHRTSYQLPQACTRHAIFPLSLFLIPSNIVARLLLFVCGVTCPPLHTPSVRRCAHDPLERLVVARVVQG